jgi:16S rRNA (adenine1518-N6/adenine1519-N6)-dimethyltransferase
MGILTRELCKKAKEVTAIELDPAMVAVLKTSCIKHSNLRVINDDVLKFNPSGIGAYKVVSNVPYYITSAIIKLFLEAENKPEEMVLLVQREVAERICAKPSRMSTLAVAVQFYGNPSIVGIVPRSSFYPAPKVDSAIVKIKVYKRPLFDVNTKLFFRLVRAGFAEKRKQLENSLSHSLCITKEESEKLLIHANINPQARAETLNLKDWYNLYKSYLKNNKQ